MQSTNIWWFRPSTRVNGLFAVTARCGSDFADGTHFDADSDVDHMSAGAPLYELSPTESGGLAHLTISSEQLGAAPSLWFCWVDEPGAHPAAANLVAYADERVPSGTIISAIQFASMNNRVDEQVGAIRWYHDGGLIHQIYVAPSRRRENIGSALLLAAGAWHQAHGWPGRLHADGRRTDLGQKFAAGQQFAQRIGPLSETMPEMDEQ